MFSPAPSGPPAGRTFDRVCAMAAGMKPLKDADREAIGNALAAPPIEGTAALADLARRGVPQAQALYGQRLLDGEGIKADPAAALEMFRKAAKAGHAMAMTMVGRAYETGQGVAQSLPVAAVWYKKAGAAGSEWGLYNLATLMTLGRGVPKDQAKAFALYRQAAARGHVKSMTLVGGFYEDGWVVEKNRDLARESYRRAAEAGDFRGQFNFARFLGEEGRLDEAKVWLGRAKAAASPDFTAKMIDFLAASPIALFNETAKAWKDAAP